MKQYIASNHLRLIGKGWEIRHQLQKLAAAGDNVSLSRFTSELPPLKVTLGGLATPRIQYVRVQTTTG
ncbi:Z-ring formation inhibitor MciZ [Paenibacillus paeoniae]|uniref:Z-ring formation inhibitor MciZ n=1 Tax=Paenibacillus paeoniae TaxID=2292705 RepID=A0A371PMC0_9BACL|nr:Z-ring formation inhibitor MciZ [Paenibacillus paeoniae]REK77321.1 Z-ring formation inhibitor MciZ [Paenibacillus paeoniae]